MPAGRRTAPTFASIAFALLLVVHPAQAAEGMWTFDAPPTDAMRRELGVAPDADWLARAMRGSAKLGNGCSGSFVSSRGLVLTNHHCAVDCLEGLSTARQNLARDGYLARDTAAERRCPALEIDRLEEITDVTPAVRAATAGRQGAAFTAALHATSARMESQCLHGDTARTRCDVVELHHGGRYALYRYRRFDDVRLVFAPEDAIANFGGDPDNFNFPRYDLDMTVLRVYDHGAPADTPSYLRMDPAGPRAGDPVFVTGHPGRTERELTMAQLRLQQRKELARLAEMEAWRGQLVQFARGGAEERRIADQSIFFVGNSIKVTRGRLEALLDEEVMHRKAEDEDQLRRFVQGRAGFEATAASWDAIAQATRTEAELWPTYARLGRPSAGDDLRAAIALVRGATERAKPDAERLPEFTQAALPRTEARLASNAPVYPQLERLHLAFWLERLRSDLGPDHPVVKRVLGTDTPDVVADRVVRGTGLGDRATRLKLWQDPKATLASTDPMIRLALAIEPESRAVRERMEHEVESVDQAQGALIAQARYARSPSTTYPDATGTLRLSYGVVKGWRRADGVDVPPFTTISGAYARATGSLPFQLPPSWLTHRAALPGDTPFDFVSTNDIIGGNSGSPVLDRAGRVVGLAFDGNMDSLGGDFFYDERGNRTVSVDTAAIFTALKGAYRADELLKELSAP